MVRVISGKVTGRRVGKNRDGKHNVLLLQAEITSKNDIQTVELMSQAGQECNPPNGSKLSIVSIGPAWKVAIASDDKIQPVAAIGEKRVYSTDSQGAGVVAQMHLKNNGRVDLKNDNASIIVTPAGQIEVANGGATITITPAGAVQVQAAGNTEITSAQTIINNNVQVIGSLSATGNIGAGGNLVASGGIATGGATPELGKMIANEVRSLNDVFFYGKSANNHTHPESLGGTTGPPN